MRTPAKTLRSEGDGVRPSLDAVRMRQAKVEIAANRLEPSTVLQLIHQAKSESRLSQKEMAINAGISESVLSEALNGRRNFAAEWLWAQSDVFLIRFLALIAEARHLTPDNERALRVKRITELVGLLLEEVA